MHVLYLLTVCSELIALYKLFCLTCRCVRSCIVYLLHVYMLCLTFSIIYLREIEIINAVCVASRLRCRTKIRQHNAITQNSTRLFYFPGIEKLRVRYQMCASANTVNRLKNKCVLVCVSL